MRYPILSVFLAMLLLCAMAACKPDGEKGGQNDNTVSMENLKQALIGKWSNIYMKVRVNQPAESMDSVMEADESNWEEVLKIKPIVTVYRANGTYGSEYRNLKDEVFFSSSGEWEIAGDTLIAKQITPKIATYKYHLVINKNGTAEFRCKLDWSQNGLEDDDYFGIQRKWE